MGLMDVDGDGSIDYREFVKVGQMKDELAEMQEVRTPPLALLQSRKVLLKAREARREQNGCDETQPALVDPDANVWRDFRLCTGRRRSRATRRYRSSWPRSPRRSARRRSRTWRSSWRRSRGAPWSRCAPACSSQLGSARPVLSLPCSVSGDGNVLGGCPLSGAGEREGRGVPRAFAPPESPASLSVFHGSIDGLRCWQASVQGKELAARMAELVRPKYRPRSAARSPG